MNKFIACYNELLGAKFETDSIYDFVLRKLEKLIDFEYCEILFLEGSSFSLKAFLGNQNKKFEICEPGVYEVNTLIIDEFRMVFKLSVSRTVFALLNIVFKKKMSEEDIQGIETFCSLISYLIKDFELSKVFKMQLEILSSSISEKNKALKIVEEQNQKIIKADKVKTEFLSNISHELRTPLNSSLGWLNILKNRACGPLNEKQIKSVGEIEHSLICLLGMINEILDISKIESKSLRLNRCEFLPDKAIEEVLEIVRPLYEKKKIVPVFSLKGEKNVFLDYQKFQQILFNLISNAIKFSPNNSEIIIEQEFLSDQYRVKIIDEGPGIDKKFHKKIFQKFFQVPNNTYSSHASTGLGLSVVKELVKLHGGKIEVISQKDSGSAFVVTFNLK